MHSGIMSTWQGDLCMQRECWRYLYGLLDPYYVSVMAQLEGFSGDWFGPAECYLLAFCRAFLLVEIYQGLYSAVLLFEK